MKKLALCIHDLRASDGENSRRMIEAIQQRFRTPVTIHLICDRPLNDSFSAFLQKEIGAGRIEVAFHGTRHNCPKGTGRLLSFYHKHEAEYLADSTELRAATTRAFSGLEAKFAVRPGICPPCWLSSRKNARFLRSLKPAYVEAMLRMRRDGESRFSHIVSLGSPKRLELLGLRAFARLMRFMASHSREPRLRMAIHPCDFAIPESMQLFDDSFKTLTDQGFKPVILRDLLP